MYTARDVETNKMRAMKIITPEEVRRAQCAARVGGGGGGGWRRGGRGAPFTELVVLALSVLMQRRDLLVGRGLQRIRARNHGAEDV